MKLSEMYRAIKCYFIAVMLLCYLSIGCNRNPCIGPSSEQVTCHFYDECDPNMPEVGTGVYCTENKVLCDCKDENKQSLVHKFAGVLPSPGYYNSNCGSCAAGNPDNFKGPYRIDPGCADGTSATICSEFTNNYVSISDDASSPRPIYLQFGIPSFSDFNFVYRIEIKKGGNLIAEKVIIDASNSSFIRDLIPTECPSLSGCYTKGTLIMNIHAAVSYGAGSYDIILSQIDGTGKTTELKRNSFIVSTNDNGFISRNCEIQPLSVNDVQSGMRDLTQYTISGKNMDLETALEYVFGEGKSNMRFGVLVPTLIESSFVDEDGDIMLDVKDLPGAGASSLEIRAALNQWILKVYQKYVNASTFINRAFAVEVDFMKSYDLTTNQPAGNNATFNGNAYDNFKTTFGITIPANNWTTHAGSIVLGYPIRRNYIGSSTDFQSKTTVKELAMRSFLHEAGHAWSSQGLYSSSNDCEMHTRKCNGDSKDICLWQTTCAGGSNPLSLEEYLIASVSNPTFCEGHQQIFMNQLRMR